MRNVPVGLIYGGALALSSAANFIALLIWTRLLPPAQFGTYALVSGTALFLNATCFEWLRQTSSRMLVEPGARFGVSAGRSDAMALIALVSVGLAAGLIGTAYAAGLTASGLSSRWWPVIGIFAVSEMLLAIMNTLTRFRMLPWQYFRSMASRGVISLLFGVPLVTLGWGAMGAIVGVIAAQLSVVGASFLADRFWRTLRPARAQRDDIRAMLDFGLPLIASNGAAYAVGFVDRFLVGQMLGLHALGLYAAPFDLMQKTLVFLLLAINLTAGPRIFHAFETSGSQAAQRLLEENFLLQIGLGVPTVAALTALAPGLSGLLLGQPFRASAVALLPMISIAVLCRSLISFHAGLAFQLTKRTRLLIIAPGISLAFLVIGGTIGVQLFGLAGMAAAAAAAQVLGYTVAVAIGRRISELRIPWGETAKILFAAVIMGMLLWPLRGHDGAGATVLLLALGGTVYGSALLALRSAPLMPFLTQLRAALSTG